MRCLSLLLVLILPASSSAICLEHEVLPGDTLPKLALHYFGDKDLWKKIAQQNAVGTHIRVGTILRIHVEDYNDWKIECDHILASFLEKQRINTDAFSPALVLGIEAAEKYVVLSSEEKLFLCKAAIATMKQESNFSYVMGRAGEIGYYQFLPKTITGVLEKNGIKINTGLKFLKTLLRDVTFATFLFVLHFSALKEQYGVFGAWYKYNGSGYPAKIYARTVYNKYKKVDAIPNFCCRKQN